MRAISLHQPHASFVAYGFKPFETRHWATDYRGPVLIHAAKRKMNRDDVELARYVFAHDNSISWGNVEPDFFGAFLCIVDLIDCIAAEKLTVSEHAASNLLGDFSAGRFAWKLDNCRRINAPIKARGYQNFWNAENPQQAAVRQPWRAIL